MTTNDYDRVRAGIEAMTAYISGEPAMDAYIADIRAKDGNLDHLADSATALCAALLFQIAGMTGKTQHEVLQELAHGLNRSEAEQQG
ncbi:hypothetical protein DCW30_16380 [Streptomyces alfalfae]|uniref:Uncharacterized protein n=1 Tax=Streptomyces alfalfae TaxID=1642299 RepID=A0A1P8TQ71_9ACTN|nr:MULTISPECIES: hypothetical protein [Streptomyces]AYA20243.1 hypothetical protein D3X13_31865 [Streptomyces fradiae]APY89790.1 hypothetical protein A7J05_32580 [Streptomyces alfalfae]KUL54107.1 hypothetical protein ADL30_16655 [Streptomyces sp. NRRL S-1521]QQC87723.1 hypothetical protein I8755_04350 [Streptomyces alfalfae]QUI30155.1 hypothetical protein H9W91_04240 [Streptomyces alfalfae]